MIRVPRRAAMAGSVLALGLVLGGCGSGTAVTGAEVAAGPASDAAASPSADPSVSQVAPTPSTPCQSYSSDDGAHPTTGGGTYLTYADYEQDPSAYAGTAVVLFFHASWCPSCRATEQAVRASGVPAGLTLVKVDYDTATDLRRRYGVTVQHTFVQVAADGTEVATWTGSADGAAILAATA